MSTYVTQATIRKMPLQGQMKGASFKQSTFAIPGVLHSCVGGVIRSQLESRVESMICPQLLKTPFGSLEKNRG